MPDKSEALVRVTEATARLRGAELEYRSALRAALEAGAGYAATGRAAGMTRQAVFKFARYNWPELSTGVERELSTGSEVPVAPVAVAAPSVDPPVVSVPSGLAEEFALEVAAAGELERRGDELWQAGEYVPALAAYAESGHASDRAAALQERLESQAGALGS